MEKTVVAVSVEQGESVGDGRRNHAAAVDVKGGLPAYEATVALDQVDE